MAAPVSAPTIPEQHRISCVAVQRLLCAVRHQRDVFPGRVFRPLVDLRSNGLGIPTDFVNVWSAGRLVLDGHPALAYDWDIQKQVAGRRCWARTFVGNFAWHYPPPFLFVASLLAQFPYAVAFIGWVAVSLVPYLAVMRAIVGRPFGWLLAAAFPVVLTNTLVGQNGFLTASLIGGMLYLLPMRPVLSGICLGLLSYKPQYGLLFPLVLIAAVAMAGVFHRGDRRGAMAVVSWLAFGTESWQAFFHWMPMFSQAFLTEGRAPWGKMQSIFALVRYFGGSEQLGWVFQWIMTAAVAVVLVLLWRSRVRYSLKAAALATGTLLVTPYLFLYDLMVLAIAVAFLVRIGLSDGFRRHELPALGLMRVPADVLSAVRRADRLWRDADRRGADCRPLPGPAEQCDDGVGRSRLYNALRTQVT